MANALDPGPPILPLRASSVEEHCRGLLEIRTLPFWWYQGISRLFGNYSLPFKDRNGNWWYQVKRGLCWPVDFLRPINAAHASPMFAKSFLGYQHVAPEVCSADSRLVINVVSDVSAYGFSAIDAKRRNAVRKGLKSCTIEIARELDTESLGGCRKAWDELTLRTGWKRAADPITFAATWQALLTCPGVTIMIGREVESGQIAGFLIVKIIGDTAYVDTIASQNAMLGTNVNDALLFTFICSAARLPGVRTAHYAIRSTVENLERFKSSIGFKPVPFPAVTRLRPLVGWAVRLLRPAAYRRMVGQFGRQGESA